jgi:C4-type Zn-finger protein
MTDQITLSGLDTDEIIAAKLHNPTNARKIEFRSKTLQDLETNVLKTDSTFMAIPELDIEVNGSTFCLSETFR